MNEHTFVVCAYGESHHLEKCILSIKNQTKKSKIIIATSTPNEYISRFAKKYNIVIVSHEGGSIGKDWNFGYECAKTKYVTLAHQDDIYAKDYSKLILDKMEKNPDTLITFSDYREIRNGRVVPKNKNIQIKELMLLPLRISSKNRTIKRGILSLGNPICCPSIAYNKDKLNRFKFDAEMNTNLDWAAWAHLANLEGNFIYINKPLMCHRIHEDSETSNTIKNNRRAQEDLMMLEMFWPKTIAKLIFRLYTKSENGNKL